MDFVLDEIYPSADFAERSWWYYVVGVFLCDGDVKEKFVADLHFFFLLGSERVEEDSLLI